MAILLVAVVAAALLGAVIGIALAELGPRARARRVQAALGEPPAQLDPQAGGETTVDGVLTFDGGAAGEIVTVAPRGAEDSEVPVPGATTSASDGAAVQVGKRRVRLEGAMQVLVGSRHAAGGARAIRAGDPVRARGRLHVLASDDAEGGYRDPSEQWCLGPPADEEWRGRPIPLAFLGRPRRPPALRVMPAIAGALALSAAAGAGMGYLAVKPPPAAQLVAPGPPSRPACAEEIGALLDAGRLWDAEARAASCTDPLTQARVRWSLGDFKAASRAYGAARAADPRLEPTVTEAEAHALAGDPGRASEVVRLMADAWYRGPETRERRVLLCIADAFAARVDPAAVARLQAVYDQGRWPQRPDLDCALLLADLKADPDGRIWSLQTDDDPRALRRLLIAEPGKSTPYFADDFLFENYPLPAMKDPRSWLHHRPLAVERRIAEQPHDTFLRGECAAEVGMFHAFMGDADRARAMLEKVPATGHDRTTYIVAAIAAVHAGLYPEAERFLQLGRGDSHAVAFIRRDIALLRGDADADLAYVASTEPWSPNREIFQAARGGDGAAVAAELSRLRMDARMTLLRVLPHIRTGREALSRWVEREYPPFCATCGLFALAEHTGTRFVLARAIGHKDLAGRLEPVARALTDAVLDRTHAMPLLLLESFVR